MNHQELTAALLEIARAGHAATHGALGPTSGYEGGHYMIKSADYRKLCDALAALEALPQPEGHALTGPARAAKSVELFLNRDAECDIPYTVIEWITSVQAQVLQPVSHNTAPDDIRDVAEGFNLQVAGMLKGQPMKLAVPRKNNFNVRRVIYDMRHLDRAFEHSMLDRHYGEEERRNAKDWFEDGYKAGRAYTENDSAVKVSDLMPLSSGLPVSGKECLQDVVSHHHDFVNACKVVHARNEENGNNDTAAYWQKQIEVLDRMKEQAEQALSTKIIDIDAALLDEVVGAYIERFGPLPEEMMTNDVVSSVVEIIKTARSDGSPVPTAQNVGLVIVSDDYLSNLQTAVADISADGRRFRTMVALTNIHDPVIENAAARMYEILAEHGADMLGRKKIELDVMRKAIDQVVLEGWVTDPTAPEKTVNEALRIKQLLDMALALARNMTSDSWYSSGIDDDDLLTCNHCSAKMHDDRLLREHDRDCPIPIAEQIIENFGSDT
jgi:hypothetical protein